jgi:hypothetical protein
MHVSLSRAIASHDGFERLGPIDTGTIALGPSIERKVVEIDYFVIDRVLPPDHDGESPSSHVDVVDGNRQHGVGYVPGSEAAARFGITALADLVESTGFPFHEVKFDSAGHEIVHVDCAKWSAFYNREPGGPEDPDLHVTGECTTRIGGVKLTLEPGEVGVAPEPGLLALELTAELPEVVTEVVTPVSVSWSGDVGPDITRVRVQGAATAEIDVTIAE